MTKLVGAALPARWSGLSTSESLVIGTGMSARGAAELIVANVALQAGLIAHPQPIPPIVANMFSVTIIMAIATTLLPPLGIRWLLRNERGQGY